MKKIRLDQLLTSKKVVENRSQAQRIIMSGDVKVNGQVFIKPGTFVCPDSEVEITNKPKYVSRGGLKLEAALIAFGLIDLEDRICVDVGASTGGFTDCLLQHKAKFVYAVDVGYGQLEWKIRNDARVKVLERSNARYIKGFDDEISLVTIDASFISLKILLPVIKGWFGQQKGDLIALIKPQFEAGRVETAKGAGVIRNPEVHQKVLMDVSFFSIKMGYGIKGLIRSPLQGPKGNTEFLIYLDTKQGDSIQIEDTIRSVIRLGKANQK